MFFYRTLLINFFIVMRTIFSFYQEKKVEINDMLRANHAF
jgi:hypothetical protein